jgi:Ser/Thr protein kinase RdoA (MazF antagonist)
VPESDRAAPAADLMLRFARTALPRWDLDVVDITPIKVRENAVYAVNLRDGRRVALRVHRHGYHSDAALRSELAWCQALARAGIDVPMVVTSRAGLAFEVIDVDGAGPARQVDIFEWIDGRQLGSAESGVGGDVADIARSYTTLGELAARMHNQSQQWQAPAEFVRHAWDAQGLMGEKPLWGRFWELSALTAAQKSLFLRLRSRIAAALAEFGAGADRFGLIHADLVPENVMVGAGGLRIIDFDDAGFGWHLFEIATSLYFIRREPYYEVARDAVIAGYRRHRALSDEHLSLLPMFLAARATTYLGWVHTRRGEPTAEELTPALIELAVPAAEDYLNA